MNSTPENHIRIITREVLCSPEIREPINELGLAHHIKGEGNLHIATSTDQRGLMNAAGIFMRTPRGTGQYVVRIHENHINPNGEPSSEAAVAISGILGVLNTFAHRQGIYGVATIDISTAPTAEQDSKPVRFDTSNIS